MLKRFVAGAAVVCAGLFATINVLAQNSNSSTTVRPRTTTQSNTNKPATQTNTNKSTSESGSVQNPPAAKTKVAPRVTQAKPAATSAADTPGSQAVREAFDTLLNGIRNADVNAVASVYWNSPRLSLFNNNGTVTKGWDQMRRNRESSYKDVKDVKLTCRDVSITMLGRDGAVGTCLWTQSQTFRGEPETASGRMTLVFKRVGKDWKAIHLHTSPDRPEPSRLPESDKAASPSPTP
jgi:ketosteroid isomerase-like protein